jgi:C4-dicarboxylate transporter DctQ subunit
VPAFGRALAVAGRGVDLLCRAAVWLGALVALAMAGLLGYAVVLRYLLNRPQAWTDELVSYLVVLLVMLAGAEVMRRGEHLAVDLVSARLPAAWRRGVEIAGLLSVLLVCGVLVVSGWEMTAFSKMVDLRSTGHLALPVWWVQATIPAGFLLIGLAALVRLLRLLTPGAAPPAGRS